MKAILKSFLIVSSLIVSPLVYANISVPMHLTTEKGEGKLVGTVEISKTKYGLLFTPKLHDLTPGIHGFHIHQEPSCEKNGMAAGGHLDPNKTEKHLGPYNDKGHLGDLPPLYINADGTATISVLAPRLTSFDQIKNHALMIHVGGDNYSDSPEKLGGGGMRMVCGIIKPVS